MLSEDSLYARVVEILGRRSARQTGEALWCCLAHHKIAADYNNHRIRKVSPDGIITTIAGNGPTCVFQGAFNGDGGPATQERLYGPADVALGQDGSLYIADYFNGRRKISPDEIITTAAGNWGFEPINDGYPATQAEGCFHGFANLILTPSRGKR